MKTHPLQLEFDDFVRRQLPELERSRLAVACSGGLDSVVLTELVAARYSEPVLFHINYQLRGSESDEEEDFVRSLANRLGLEIEVARAGGIDGLADYPGSLQMKAREFRYRRFTDWAREKEVDCVLTAHHLGDSLESFLLNMSRGTGLKGLMGIPLRRGLFRRPLLFATRNSLREYAEYRGLQWREDSSNRKTVYQRNYLRQQVVPGLEGLHPDFWKRFQRTLQWMNQASEWQQLQLQKLKNELFQPQPNGIAIGVQALKDLKPRAYLLYELFESYGFSDPRLLDALLDSEPGKRIASTTHELIREPQHLLLLASPENLENAFSKGEVYYWSEAEEVIGQPLRLKKSSVDVLGPATNRRIYVDRDLIDFPLWIRKWRAGDYFQPFGMQGRKKVAKFLRDECVSYVEKQQICVLGSGDRIIWVIGLRAEEAFRVTPETLQILCFEWIS